LSLSSAFWATVGTFAIIYNPQEDRGPRTAKRLFFGCLYDWATDVGWGCILTMCHLFFLKPSYRLLHPLLQRLRPLPTRAMCNNWRLLRWVGDVLGERHHVLRDALCARAEPDPDGEDEVKREDESSAGGLVLDLRAAEAEFADWPATPRSLHLVSVAAQHVKAAELEIDMLTIADVVDGFVDGVVRVLRQWELSPVGYTTWHALQWVRQAVRTRPGCEFVPWLAARELVDRLDAAGLITPANKVAHLRAVTDPRQVQ